MATYKDVMRWIAELDVTDPVKGFRKLETEGKKSLDAVADEADDVEGKMSSRFRGIGDKIGSGILAGFAAVGVGAGMVESLQRAWDKAGGIRQITGQFRLSSEEAAKYGRVAGELYADNWGESLPELQQVVALAGERLEDATGKTLGAISEQIVAVSQTWGTDYESIIRSITQLTDNGLAPSSQAALDLIVTGFQDGGDEAGDFLDTIDEYSQHWEAMGLSGEDALNQIIAGFQGGQRDADKLADAVKEMRIRVVEDTDAITEAYETLGLDADDTREKFLEGGDAAREAFLDVLRALRSVEDPVEQNRLAIALIGTQYEDLGPKALEALSSVQGYLSETEGAAADLAETVGEVSPWDRLQRRGERALGAIGDRMARLVQADFGGANEVLAELREEAEALNEEFGTGNAVINEWVDDAVTYAIDAAKELDRESTYLADSQSELRRITDLTRDATKLKAEADREAEDAARRHREEIRNVRDEIGHLKREIDDRQAWLDLQDTFDDTTAKLNDTTLSARDQERAMLDLKEEVLNYAETINLPDSVVTKLIADIDEGKRAEVELFLARIGNGVTLPIKPFVLPTGGNNNASIYIDPAGNVHHRAMGGPVSPGQTYVVGEKGPELLHMGNQSGNITPNHKLGGASGGGGAPPSVVVQPGGIVLQGTNLTGRDVVEALATYVRQNGAAPVRKLTGL